jgi:hypothetical protein
MRTFTSILILVGCMQAAFAQNCRCEVAFGFLKNQIENNYSGFKDKATGKNTKAYQKHSNKISALAKKTTQLHYCIGLHKEWLEFFKDGHLQISETEFPAITDSLQLNAMEQSTEIKLILPDQISHIRNKKGVEGIYHTKDTSYQIAIIKSKTSYRDYAGIILTSKTPKWKPGQVKLELKSISATKYIAYLYYKDHSGHFLVVDFNGQTLNNGGWIKEGVKPNAHEFTSYNPVESKKLTDSTLYIQIASFDPWNANAIDSVIRGNAHLLETMPNLILDLRNNGGGADFAYTPLLPYLYTNPIRKIGVDVIASEENIKAWLDVLNYPDIPESTKNQIKEITDLMQKNLGQLVNIDEDDTLVLPTILPNPKRIIILVNKGCASSTEQFLLSAQQSSKVKLMGQPTHGVLDYSNMRDVKFPEDPILLSYATTRSRRIDQNMAVDRIGIQPNIVLSPSINWITKALQYLENKK